MTQLKKFIVKEKNRIITAILGFVLTTISITIYVNYKEYKSLTLVFMIANLTFGFLQFYYLYFKKKDFLFFEKVFLSFMSSLIFVTIVFVLMVIANSLIFTYNFSNLYDLLIYSIFLLPSFVLVLVLLLLLLLALGYM